MKVLRSIPELHNVKGPVHLAIGVFDGVHVGHRTVIEQALAAAQVSGGTAVVATFDPHPAQVLRPNAAPPLLVSTRHKLRLLETLGAPCVLMIPFDSHFAATPPADFVLQLAAVCQPLGEICVGEDWTFGKGRTGGIELLRQLGEKLGFQTTAVQDVSTDGMPVSSTAIRAAVQSGDLESAQKMLGRAFSILGVVGEGRHIGRSIGFPTANVRPESEQLPPNGVYAVRAEFDGTTYPGVANVGLRPTVEPEAVHRLVEVHLFDYSGDLYNRDMEVSFMQFLRPERKFESIDELKAQISLDVIKAREMAVR